MKKLDVAAGWHILESQCAFEFGNEGRQGHMLVLSGGPDLSTEQSGSFGSGAIGARAW